MAVVTFIKRHVATANASSYTFSSTSTGGANDIGATASDRRVIVGGFLSASTTATRTINTITIGGVAGTIAIKTNGQLTSTATQLFRSASVAIAHAGISTATSIAIVLTATTTVANAGIGVWSATEGAATATYGASFASSTRGWALATAATMAITGVGVSGYVVAQAGQLNLPFVGFDWTNMSQKYDLLVENPDTLMSGAQATASATVGVSLASSRLFGVVWAAFADETPPAAGETLFRKFNYFPGTVAGRRNLVA